MQFGMGVLRLSPVDFWAMTPRELAAAMGAWSRAAAEPPERHAVDRLLADFPDTQDTCDG